MPTGHYKRKPMSEETKKKIGDANRGKPTWKTGVYTIKFRECPQCKIMHRPVKRSQKFCCRACDNEYRRNNTLSNYWRKGHNKGKTGRLCHNWKGGWLSQGYRMFKDKIDIAEHRYVMEKNIGRKLESNEIVHHVNGDRTDNRIENLQLMTWGEHTTHHLNIRWAKK